MALNNLINKSADIVTRTGRALQAAHKEFFTSSEYTDVPSHDQSGGKQKKKYSKNKKIKNKTKKNRFRKKYKKSKRKSKSKK